MNWFNNAEADAKKTEQWVVAEFTKGWKALEAGAQKAAIDVKGLFDYIAGHQTQIDATAKAILGDVNVIAALAGHPEVALATDAIGLSAQAVVGVAAKIDQGSVPLPDLVDALHKTKDAQTAVNNLVKVATAKPAAK